jgi:hypothetical protein
LKWYSDRVLKTAQYLPCTLRFIAPLMLIAWRWKCIDWIHCAKCLHWLIDCLWVFNHFQLYGLFETFTF